MDEYLGDEPQREDFQNLSDFIVAFERFHDQRAPTAYDLLDRASRLASESMRAITIQLRRMRGSEPEDEEWLFRAWMDFQFLIVALWRLRTVAKMAVSTDNAVQGALDEFDQELLHLGRMRHVAQHIDDYGADTKRRRQTKPGSADLIGRRLLEVGSWDQYQFKWLGATLDLHRARIAAERLYSSVRAARDSTRS